MLSFMVLGLPRSGTTWAANWLCTDTLHCLHDPLWKWHYLNLDNLSCGKKLGVSCTGLWSFPQWVNKHPAQKLILHRDLEEINTSLHALGMPPYMERDEMMLDALQGLHVKWTDLFERPAPLWEHLTGQRFGPSEAMRHVELATIRMQPEFSKITINKDVTKRLMREVHATRSEIWPG